jgi:hypothetical protein
VRGGRGRRRGEDGVPESGDGARILLNTIIGDTQRRGQALGADVPSINFPNQSSHPSSLEWGGVVEINEAMRRFGGRGVGR